MTVGSKEWSLKQETVLVYAYGLKIKVQFK